MTNHSRDSRWSKALNEDGSEKALTVNEVGDGRGEPCCLCGGEGFSAGRIAYRIQRVYRDRWRDSDYKSLSEELRKQFDIEISAGELREHDQHHMSYRR